MYLRSPLIGNKPAFGAQLAENQYSKGLVGIWPFRKAGDLVDYSHFGRHGTITGPVWQGHGLDFERDTTDFVDIGILPTMTEWSIAVQVTPESIVTSTSIGYNFISNDRGGWNDDVLFGISPEDDSENTHNRIACNQQDSTNQVRTIVTDTVDAVVGQEYFVVVTSDGLSLRLYIDGQVRDETAKNGAALTFDGAQTFIGKTPNVSRPYDGIMSYMSIYDRALNAPEIAGLSQNLWLPFQQDRILFAPTAAVTGAVRLIDGGLVGSGLVGGRLIV